MERQRFRVALLIESSRAYGRGVLEGIAEYAKTHRNWSIYMQSRSPDDPPPPWLAGWQGDGIIARVERQEMVNAIKQSQAVTIDVRGVLDSPFPLVETNDRKVAELCVEHFQQRGFSHFGFCGIVEANYSKRRLRYFQEILTAAGKTCHVLETTTRGTGLSLPEQQALLYADQLFEWLQTLPRPIGLMACNDVYGQQILNACRELGIAVPEEIAVIGVDDDELHCELSDPPLSSVAPDTRRIGYLAAEQLNRLMRGEAVSQLKTFVDPLGIVTRQSTDVLAIDDADVARAIRYIRAHACDGIDVNSVVKHVSISRRKLERKFRDQLSRSPNEEILRVRLDRARELIAETEIPLRRVAEMSGFKHAEYLSYVFRKHVGMRPTDYRASHATGGR